MGEISDYIWAFPLIGGILTLIALLTPAAYLFEFGNFLFIWMWGLLSIHISDPYLGTFNLVTFTDNPLILIPSIIFSVVILINIIILFLSSYFYRRERNEGNILKSRGLVPSILIIISTILWMISIEISFMIGPASISFWFNYNTGFGVIGMFLGAALGIIGYGISKYMVKQRKNVIFLPNKKFPMSMSTSPTNTTSKFNFCPECGQNIVAVAQRFCVNCGFELKNI